jgi:hypothetical protein
VQLTLRDAPGAGSITIAGVPDSVAANNVKLAYRTSTASPLGTLDGILRKRRHGEQRGRPRATRERDEL